MDVAVRLNTNESPTAAERLHGGPCPAHRGLGNLNRYPTVSFRELRERLRTRRDPHRACLGGQRSNEVILQLVQAFGGLERKAMTFEPTYAMHSHITRVSSTRLIRARRSPDFTMDLDASLDAVRMNQPDVVFLCSPNNPTGNTISEEEVAAICEAAPGLVILDEAYAESRGLAVAAGRGPRELASVRTFSKAYRMAGARIGYMVAQGR